MNKIDKKWQLKIICLLLAIVLWFVIINEQNPLSEGSYTVPITVENLDSQYITSNVPKTVYVRLSGPRNTIINVGPSDIKAYIDLSSVQEGEVEVPVHIEIPSGTELKKQSMTSTKITVDVYTVKEFKLTPHVVGKLDDKDFISDLKIVPEKSRRQRGAPPHPARQPGSRRYPGQSAQWRLCYYGADSFVSG
jgi:hypothetical protein